MKLKSVIALLCMLAAQTTSNACQLPKPYPFQSVLMNIEKVEKIPANQDTQVILNRLRSSFTRAVYDELPKDENGHLKDTAVLDRAALCAVVQAAHESKALHEKLSQKTGSPHGPLTETQLQQVSHVINWTFRLAYAFKKSNDALKAQEKAKKTAQKGEPQIYCNNPDCWQINPCMNKH